MTEPPVLDSLDWKLFAERHWDREPVLFRGVAPAPFQADEVFRAAVQGTRPPGPRLMPPNAQFTIGREQQTRPGSWLPQPSDGSLAGYGERLARELGGRRYALVVHGFHTGHAPLWQRERAFYQGLWEQVGQPAGGVITTLFHGTYEHSPVGVHRDRFATFMYALRGRKRMRFWPVRPWSGPMTTVLDYAHCRESSFSVEVAPGDLLYWPSSHYHVGESAAGGDEPATSVNVGVPREDHRAVTDLMDLLVGLDASALLTLETDIGRLPRVPDSLLVPPAEAPAGLSGELPAALDRALALFRGLGEPGRLADLVRVRSLEHWTAGGFRPAPPPGPLPPPAADAEVLRATEPVLWTEGEDGELLCGAAGHVARTRLPRPDLIRLLRALGGARPPAVGALLSGLPSGTAAAAGRLLRELESFGAVARERAGSAPARDASATRDTGDHAVDGFLAADG
ncbi:hypothetical protein GCM10009716_34960 [Streptomyces sodiiphilus]|uniref:JmjC domain-containing protein n=1 Tax=Streptomyces sodiiphilus TaxID=226217 RepID=A0ABN2PJM5_9ACTN